MNSQKVKVINTKLRPKTVKKRNFWRIVQWLLGFEIKLTHIVTYKQTNQCEVKTSKAKLTELKIDEKRHFRPDKAFSVGNSVIVLASSLGYEFGIFKQRRYHNLRALFSLKQNACVYM